MNYNFLCILALQIICRPRIQRKLRINLGFKKFNLLSLILTLTYYTIYAIINENIIIIKKCHQ